MDLIPLLPSARIYRSMVFVKCLFFMEKEAVGISFSIGGDVNEILILTFLVYANQRQFLLLKKRVLSLKFRSNYTLHCNDRGVFFLQKRILHLRRGLFSLFVFSATVMW